MRGAMTVKDILKKFYSGYSVYIDIIVKACTAFACFYWIASIFEGKGILANTFILLIAALLCSVLPVRFIPVVSAVFIVSSSAAPPKAMLRSSRAGIPALVPICYGLRKRPSAVLAVGSGCILYYLLSAVTSNKEALLEFGKTEYVARLTLLMESINSGNEMVVSILALSGVVVIVYAFRRLGFAHAYEVACVSGGLVYLFFIILGNSISLTQFDLAREGIGAAAAIIVSLILGAWFSDPSLRLKGQRFFKTVIYLPNLIMASAFSMLFFTLFADSGPINSILISMGIISGPFKFMSHVWSVRGLVAFMNFIMWFGNTTILLMAGMMGIDPALYEAAQVDGATATQIFYRITLPLLRPILLYVMITSLIGGLQMFDVPQILTNGTGDPVRKSMTLIMYLNKHLWSKNYGMGGALSVLLFIITGIFSFIVFKINTRTDK